MCGIIGYAGNKKAAPILLKGLEKLEYRGYDSAGIGVIERGKIVVEKSKGRLSMLSSKINNGENLFSNIGIGHTRWATHGEPTDQNSHPHISQSGQFAVVHNGIIENYAAIKEMLIKKGFNFVSQTDTEVVAQLLECCYDGNSLSTLLKVIKLLEGSYALGILSFDNPEQILAVKKSSPLIIGLGTDENFIASDVTAVAEYTKKVYYVEDDEIVVLSKNDVQVYNKQLKKIQKKPQTIHWDVKAAEKCGYEHFMMKEIQEQPKAVNDTINMYLKDGEIELKSVVLDSKPNKIFIVACGSAYHVGVVGKYIMEDLCKIPVETAVASEFRYSNPLISKNDLVILISQSGETADTLAALMEAKSKGAMTLAIVNVVGSSIAKAADEVIYTWAGPEIAVASTKAYSTQLCVIYMITLYMAHASNTITNEEYESFISELLKLPKLIRRELEEKERVKNIAKKLYSCKNVFFIGRNTDYAVSLEGSLKLKEISYIHSEAYAAGEMKHGTISLIEKGSVVVAVTAYKKLYLKTVSNIKEVKARGADVLIITNADDKDVCENWDFTIGIPDTESMFMPSLAVIPLQLFAYYVAYFKECDIDKPRNLAKSVTVE